MGPLLNTGLFIPLHKQSLFILIFEEKLINSYNVIPLFWPTSEENTFEIKLKYMKENTAGPSSMTVDTKMAKRYLRKNIHILKEHSRRNKKNLCIAAKQVIDLDNENVSTNSKLVRMVDLTRSEPEIIILDDSVHQVDKTSEFDNEVSVIDLDETLKFSGRTHKSANSEIGTLRIKNKRRSRSLRSVSFSSESGIKVVESTFKFKPKRFSSNSSQNSVRKSPLSRPTKRRNSNPTQTNQLKHLVSSIPVQPLNITKNRGRSKRKTDNVSNTRSPLRSVRTPPQPKTLSDGVLRYYKDIAGVLDKKRKKSPLKRTLPCKLIENKVTEGARSHSRKRNKETQEVLIQNHITHRLPNSPLTSITPYRKIRGHKTGNIGESNIFNPNPLDIDIEGLRPIVIDGSNLAIQHGKGKFSVKGVKICIDYFANRGHKDVKVFFPQYRQENFSEDLLKDLREKCDIIFTPSRCINGVRMTSYDDRFIVQYAVEFGGVIVSTDNYRDLLKENRRWRETIEKRLLMFTWVDDVLMFPVDPLGRSGPTLEQFLRF